MYDDSDRVCVCTRVGLCRGRHVDRCVDELLRSEGVRERCNSERLPSIFEQWREYLLILRREEYSAMTARTLLHFCEPLVLRGLLAAAGISVSRPLLSKDSEVVDVALTPTGSLSNDSPWLEDVSRRYSSDNLRRRQNPDGLPLSLSFSPTRLPSFARSSVKILSFCSLTVCSFLSDCFCFFFFILGFWVVFSFLKGEWVGREKD